MSTAPARRSVRYRTTYAIGYGLTMALILAPVLALLYVLYQLAVFALSVAGFALAGAGA